MLTPVQLSGYVRLRPIADIGDAVSFTAVKGHQHHLARRLGVALVGKSDQWLLTIVLPVLLTKVLLIPIALLFSLAASDADLSAAFEDYSGTIRKIDAALVVDSLIVAPLLETLISTVLVWLLGFKLHLPASPTACVVALIFVPLHGLTPGSLIVVPAFLIWALIQYNWMARGGGETGFKIVVASHSLANLTALGASSLMSSLS